MIEGDQCEPVSILNFSSNNIGLPLQEEVRVRVLKGTSPSSSTFPSFLTSPCCQISCLLPFIPPSLAPCSCSSRPFLSVSFSQTRLTPLYDSSSFCFLLSFSLLHSKKRTSPLFVWERLHVFSLHIISAPSNLPFSVYISPLISLFISPSAPVSPA